MFSRDIIFHCIVSVICVFISLTLSASTEIEIGYGFEAELHRHDDNKATSSLLTSIAAEQTTSDFSLYSDLDIGFFMEHEQQEEYLEWDGEVDSAYRFTPYLTWLLEIGLTEIDSDDGSDSTQTFANGTTGFRYALENMASGILSLTLLRSEFYYEKSPLGGSEESLAINYIRPMSNVSSFSISASQTQQRNEIETQSVYDSNNSQVRLGYNNATSFYKYGAYVERNGVELINQTSNNVQDIDGFGFDFTYLINSNSTLLLTYADSSVEQAYTINSDLIDVDHPLTIAGFVKSKTTSIQYSMGGNSDSFSAEIYRYDIEDIAAVSDNDGVTDGVLINYTRRFDEKWSLKARYNENADEVKDSSYQQSTVATIYQINESAAVSSDVRFSIEEGTDDGEDIDDLVVTYQLTANLY